MTINRLIRWVEAVVPQHPLHHTVCMRDDCEYKIELLGLRKIQAWKTRYISEIIQGGPIVTESRGDIAFGCCEVLTNKGFGNLFECPFFGRRRRSIAMVLVNTRDFNKINQRNLQGVEGVHSELWVAMGV